MTITSFVVGLIGFVITICSFVKIKKIDEKIRDKKLEETLKEELPKWIADLERIRDECLYNNVEYVVKLKEILNKVIEYVECLVHKKKITELARKLLTMLNNEHVILNGIDIEDELIVMIVKLEKEKIYLTK